MRSNPPTRSPPRRAEVRLLAHRLDPLRPKLRSKLLQQLASTLSRGRQRAEVGERLIAVPNPKPRGRSLGRPRSIFVLRKHVYVRICVGIQTQNKYPPSVLG
jgi:hypothetical protein